MNMPRVTHARYGPYAWLRGEEKITPPREPSKSCACEIISKVRRKGRNVRRYGGGRERLRAHIVIHDAITHRKEYAGRQGFSSQYSPASRTTKS